MTSPEMAIARALPRWFAGWELRGLVLGLDARLEARLPPPVLSTAEYAQAVVELLAREQSLDDVFAEALLSARPRAREEILRLVRPLLHATLLRRLQSMPAVGPLQIRLHDAERPIEHGSRVHVGTLVHVVVEPPAEGFLYLLDVGSSGSTTLLVPNRARRECRVRAGMHLRVPEATDGFAFEVHGSPGPERIQAFLLSSPSTDVFGRWPDDLSPVDAMVATRDIRLLGAGQVGSSATVGRLLAAGGVDFFVAA